MPLIKNYTNADYKDQNKWETTEYNKGSKFNQIDNVNYENVHEGDIHDYNKWMENQYLSKLNPQGMDSDNLSLIKTNNEDKYKPKWYGHSNHNEMISRNKNFTIKGEPFYLRNSNVKCNSHGSFPEGSKIKVLDVDNVDKYLNGIIVKFNPSAKWEKIQGEKPEILNENELYTIKWNADSKDKATAETSNVLKSNLEWKDGKPPMHFFINNDNLIVKRDGKNFGLTDNIIKNQSDLDTTVLIGSLSKPEKLLAFFLDCEKKRYIPEMGPKWTLAAEKSINLKDGKILKGQLEGERPGYNLLNSKNMSNYNNSEFKEEQFKDTKLTLKNAGVKEETFLNEVNVNKLNNIIKTRAASLFLTTAGLFLLFLILKLSNKK